MGELQPTPDEAAKLGSIQRVLIYHKRQDVFEAKVIDLPQAGIVLHARSILLISRPALRELSATELQAAVAHEVGHESLLGRLRTSPGGRRHSRQELELRCDAIAVLTLLDLGLDPGELVSAVRTVTRFNERSARPLRAIVSDPELRARSSSAELRCASTVELAALTFGAMRHTSLAARSVSHRPLMAHDQFGLSSASLHGNSAAS